jgi:hypothetical protein
MKRIEVNLKYYFLFFKLFLSSLKTLYLFYINNTQSKQKLLINKKNNHF